MSRCQRGLSLIEVLVALVIFSIGLLGVAGLQAYSLKVNNIAESRTKATILSDYIIERMRINDGQLPSYRISFDDCVAAVSDTSSGNSGASALTDKREWCQRIDRELRDASGRIQYSGGVARVTIRWNEQRAGVAPGDGSGSSVEQQELVVRARLSNG